MYILLCTLYILLVILSYNSFTLVVSQSLDVVIVWFRLFPGQTMRLCFGQLKPLRVSRLEYLCVSLLRPLRLSRLEYLCVSLLDGYGFGCRLYPNHQSPDFACLLSFHLVYLKIE